MGITCKIYIKAVKGEVKQPLKAAYIAAVFVEALSSFLPFKQTAVGWCVPQQWRSCLHCRPPFVVNDTIVEVLVCNTFTKLVHAIKYNINVTRRSFETELFVPIGKIFLIMENVITFN